jgi:hypothetical protein
LSCLSAPNMVWGIDENPPGPCAATRGAVIVTATAAKVTETQVCQARAYKVLFPKRRSALARAALGTPPIPDKKRWTSVCFISLTFAGRGQGEGAGQRATPSCAQSAKFTGKSRVEIAETRSGGKVGSGRRQICLVMAASYAPYALLPAVRI